MSSRNAAAARRKLVNPQSGLSFDTEGRDGQSVAIPPAPRIDSAKRRRDGGAPLDVSAAGRAVHHLIRELLETTTRMPTDMRLLGDNT